MAALAVNTTDRVCRRIFRNENISSSVSPVPTLVHAFHFTHLLDVTLTAALSLTVSELLLLAVAVLEVLLLAVLLVAEVDVEVVDVDVDVVDVVEVVEVVIVELLF